MRDPLGKKRLQIFIASLSKPPPLPRRSSIIFVAPSVLRLTSASFTWLDAFLLNFVSTMYPVSPFMSFENGTASISTAERFIVALSVFPWRLYVMTTSLFGAPLSKSPASPSTSATVMSPIFIISSPALRPALSAG